MNELAHHGIEGQRWGVRRFQNEDGSLTAAGRKRYDVDIEGQKKRVQEAKAEEKRLSRKIAYDSLEDVEKHNKAAQRVQWEKRKLSDEKVKDKLNNSSGKKSKHRLALEQKYMDKGMSAEEAEIAAYKRVRTEKAIAAAAGVTIAAAAAYAAYRHYDQNVDRVLKSGIGLQNISNTDKLDTNQRFYAAYKTADKMKYRGWYGTQLGQHSRDIYNTSVQVKGNGLKIAGRNTASETLANLMKNDKGYANDIRSTISKFASAAYNPQQQKAALKALADIDRGHYNKRVYDAFNMAAVTDGIDKKFFDTLKKSGYDAIMDMNDKKFSGYNTSSPLIIFNGTNVAKSAVSKISDKAIKSDDAKSNVMAVVREALKTAAFVGAARGAASALGAKQQSKTHDTIVDDYRREHPGTELSYNQILNNYYNSK